MFLEEFLAKPLLAEAGISIPRGRVAHTPDEAFAIAVEVAQASADDIEAAEPDAACALVIKAQVPAGKRGKSGGIQFASSPREAREVAARLLGTRLGDHPVERVLVEEKADIRRELYAAVLNDATSQGPLVLFSTEGGMDIEELNAMAPEQIQRQAVDIRHGFSLDDARALVAQADLDERTRPAVADVLAALYRRYRELDAELLEINPLVVEGSGAVKALDCKFSLDDGARARHPEIVALAEAVAKPTGTPLEQRGRAQGFLFIELDGDVGVLANGAGLTMTTMDVIAHYGGRPANFLEIGGEAYTRARPALELVLSNPKVKSLLINFCGAFARTDVMAGGVVEALEALQPDIPIAFSIHGTGEEEAIKLVRDRLGMQPYDSMDDAVKAAIQAARSGVASGASASLTSGAAPESPGPPGARLPQADPRRVPAAP